MYVVGPNTRFFFLVSCSPGFCFESGLWRELDISVDAREFLGGAPVDVLVRGARTLRTVGLDMAVFPAHPAVGAGAGAVDNRSRISSPHRSSSKPRTDVVADHERVGTPARIAGQLRERGGKKVRVRELAIRMLDERLAVRYEIPLRDLRAVQRVRDLGDDVVERRVASGVDVLDQMPCLLPRCYRSLWRIQMSSIDVDLPRHVRIVLNPCAHIRPCDVNAVAPLVPQVIYRLTIDNIMAIK